MIIIVIYLNLVLNLSEDIVPKKILIYPIKENDNTDANINVTAMLLVRNDFSPDKRHIKDVHVAGAIAAAK